MFNIGEQQLMELGTKCLMVAGGYVAGYMLTMLAGVGFDKLVTHRKSPEELHKAARIIGGLLVAILVAVLVFGGFGSGGGKGSGTGPGDQPGQTTGSEANPTDPTANPKPTDPVKAEANVTVEAVRVKVFAGDEVEKGTEKFYQLADQPERVDRGALAAAVADRKKTAKGPVVVVYEFGKQAGPSTTAFADLSATAKDQGVQVMSEAEFRQFVKK